MKKIKLKDIKNAVEVGEKVFPYMEPVVKKYGPKAAEQVVQKAKLAGELVQGVRGSVTDKMQQHKDEQDLKKFREEAKKRAINSSLPPVSAEEFYKCFEANISDSSELKTGYLAIPGCFAIITLKSPREKDVTAFKDVYVGCGNTIGFDVYSQLCGFGNIDVYADFKFKEPMKVLIYPCDQDQIKSRFTDLVEDLQSIDSYNKWEALRVTDSADN